LQRELDIPVFHDDQHGTAIVVLAALTNALKLVNKPMGTIRIVINGAGPLGSRSRTCPKRQGLSTSSCAILEGLCPEIVGI
jgi:malate dehydrogenase (oxaloacetate-decarboxylating)